MNEELDRIDGAIDAAAKELMADPPETVLKGIMYRIETDSKPHRFAFGRFTAMAAAVAVVVLAVSFGGRLFGGAGAPALTTGSTQNDSAMMDAATMDGGMASSFGAMIMSADEFSGLGEATPIPENAEQEAGGVTTTTTDSTITFSNAPELTPRYKALYEYFDSEVLSVTWIDDLTAEVEIADEDGEVVKQTVTLEEKDGVYSVVG